MTNNLLQHKVALITGSSRGIGAAIARKMVEYGAEVIVHGLRDSEQLKGVAEELDARSLHFDVTNEQAAVEAISHVARVDILVNNAGINPSKTFEELSSRDWQNIFATNLFGAIHLSRAVLDQMRECGNGTIVNIASIKGLTHVSGKPAYASAKAALIQLTARMAEEFAPFGIRVNAVAPGFTETELTLTTLRREDSLGRTTLRDQIAKIPMRRMAKPGEIAEAVCFLASDKAGYITGQCLPIDGGLSIV